MFLRYEAFLQVVSHQASADLGMVSPRSRVGSRELFSFKRTPTTGLEDLPDILADD